MATAAMTARALAFRERFERVLGIPFTEGNEIEPLLNGVGIFPAMLEAIREAEETVDFLTYVYWTGDVAVEFAHAIAEAAERGVRTRVLLDAVGARPMDRALCRLMSEAGARVEWFRPVVRWKLWQSVQRTHRKVLICDGRTGFTGGVGIAEEWEGDASGPEEWRETHFRIRGPAVTGLQAAFLGDWVEVDPDATGEPFPPNVSAGADSGVPFDFGAAVSDAARDPAPGSTPDPMPGSDGIGSTLDSTSASEGAVTATGGSTVQVLRSTSSVGWTDLALAFRTFIDTATERVRISTPYFIPDENTLELIARAAARGVGVEILVPGPHIDYRAALLAGAGEFGRLLQAGAEIRVYQPTMIHQKILTADGAVAMIGSGNFNFRSMRQDDEVQLVVADPAFTEEIDRMLDEDFRHGTPLDLSTWKRRGVGRRAMESVARLFRSQM